MMAAVRNIAAAVRRGLRQREQNHSGSIEKSTQDARLPHTTAYLSVSNVSLT